MIHGIHGVDRAAPAHRGNRRRHLVLEQTAVGAGHESGPVDQRLHLRRDVGEIRGRRQNDTVGGHHLRHAFVQDILRNHALVVLGPKTTVAGGATPQLASRQLDQLGLDPLFLQLGKNGPDQDGRVPVRPGAPVDCQHFHLSSPLLFIDQSSYQTVGPPVTAARKWAGSAAPGAFATGCRFGRSSPASPHTAPGSR